MAEDIFDVVDERDGVIGQAPRSHVHQHGLLHRAVHIWLLNTRGEIFLQRRSAYKDLHPNVWDSSCSGHVDAGEDYGVAAARELGEELGLIPAVPLRFLCKIEARPETGQEFVQVYWGWHEGPFVLPPEEISEGRFIAPHEVTAWIERAPHEWAPAFRYLWEKLK